MKINDLLKRQHSNKKVAIKHSNETLSFKEWNYKSLALSKKINSIIKTTSKHIGIYLPNSIQYAVAYFGILFSDKVVIPIGIQAKYPEIFSMLEYCEVDMLISESKYAGEIIENHQHHNNKLILYSEYSLLISSFFASSITILLTVSFTSGGK